MADTPISEQVQILQECEKSMRDMLEALGLHNQAEDSHPIILRRIKNLEESEAMYTRAEIYDLIQTQLARHTAKSIEDAHSGYSELLKLFQDQIDQIKADLESLTKKVEMKNEVSDQYNQSMEATLQAIEDKYAPILANLSTAYQEAEKQGNTVLADSYMESITTTLEEKRQDLIQAMKDWAQANKR